MKIVLAPDSFKGSLTSIQAVEIMNRAIEAADPSIETVLKPMADGGEGTMLALLKATSGKKVPVCCRDSFGETSESWYVELPDGTAVIECANIAGLHSVPEERKNPESTTTYGIGEAIKSALDRGNGRIILAIGGSSTNDGGLGMLQALGMNAWTKEGKEVGIFGRDLLEVDKVDVSAMDKRLVDVKLQIASDVKNPLTGPRGASRIYGPQKGMDASKVPEYDQALKKYGNLLEEEWKKNIAENEGAGAAGGLGFALLGIGGEIYSGAELVAQAIGLKEAVSSADLVLTGEGKSDIQTLYGKAPGYVAEMAGKFGKPVVLLSGSLEGNLAPLNNRFDGCFSIVIGPADLADCIKNAESLLFESTRQLFLLKKSLD